MKTKYRINDGIKGYDTVRVVGEDVETQVMSISDARKLAADMDLDLVEINANGAIPIVKICNYEKMAYEEKKAQKKQKHSKPLKEIQLRSNIAKHDLETKINHAKRFIKDGSRVKVTLSMKGRELLHRDENQKPLLEFIVMMENEASLEGSLKNEGNRVIAYLKKK